MNKVFSEIKNKLTDRPIKILGLGGIGSPLCFYLTKFIYSLNSNNTIFLIDGDEYELSNKERMFFSEFGKKATIKEKELAQIYGERVSFRSLPVYVTTNNIDHIFFENDIIFNAVDNHKTRKLVSDFCQVLSDVLLISGGNDGVENGKSGTFGNVQIYERVKHQNRYNPITRFHPEIENAKDVNPGDIKDQSCNVLINKIPQLAFTNLAVASAMLNILYTWATSKLTYEEVYLDILKAKTIPVSREVQK